MLNKKHTKKSCRVTFKLPADLAADAKQAAILGEFNEWSAEANPMKQLKDGSFSATVSLDPGQEYRFRYLLDGERWVNDESPDDLVPNKFGEYDCIINTSPEA